MSEDQISDLRALKSLKPKVIVLLKVCKTDTDLFECLCYSQQNLLFKQQRLPLLDDVHCFVRRSTLESLKKVDYHLSRSYVAPAGPRRSARAVVPNARYFGAGLINHEKNNVAKAADPYKSNAAGSFDDKPTKKKTLSKKPQSSSTAVKTKAPKRSNSDSQKTLSKNKRKK